MRRRSAPPPSAQQMIREYLGRVSVAATKVLPKGDRLLFVGRTRAAIEAKVGPLASADADAVLDALTTMGDPEELAKRERDRLYSARRRGAAAAPPALWKPSKESRRGTTGSRRGGAESRRGAAPEPAREPGPSPGRRRSRPWPHRGLTGPDEPQPAETASPPASPSGSPDSVPAVPPQADSPEMVSPPGESSPSAEMPPPPEASPSPEVPPSPEAPQGEVPRPRMPPEQALEEGWPVEPPAAASAPPESASPESAAAEPAAPEPVPPESAAGEPAAAESAAARNGSAAGVPVPDLAGLEAYAPELETPEPERPEPDVPGAGTSGSGGPEHNGTPPGWLRPGRPTPAPAPGEAEPLSIVPGMTESGEPEDHPVASRRSAAGWRSPVVALLAEAWALARKNPLEAVAVVLLGLGGLILPFPFWLIGGLVSLRSRRWDARDKWIALAGPPLVTLTVLVIRAVTSAGNFFSAFYHAAGNDVGVSIRVGCVLCAGYLIWRLRRGPRLRTLPPWQRPR
ncbi:MAG TPA: hypothetical protein VE464_22995 [Streptosporangiaceae bacterium]|nr:hypothetical protein [Streptosporangiaceae bacterium]